jgi:hypothetical protein
MKNHMTPNNFSPSTSQRQLEENMGKQTCHSRNQPALYMYSLSSLHTTLAKSSLKWLKLSLGILWLVHLLKHYWLGFLPLFLSWLYWYCNQ